MADDHFDAIIIGSGFGGSVMSYRLAQAGRRVCVLERGKAYPPNSFPRSPYRMGRNFWDPSEGLHGMFNFWSFQRIGAIVSSGLGGGSLIYANVLLRKDPKWFVKEDLSKGGWEYWPVTRKDLDPHYDNVEPMLGAQKYPFGPYPYDAPKAQAFKTAAAALGLQWDLPNLAVTFANPGQPPVPGEPIIEPHPNLHGRTRQTCRLCGECDVGCNYGSKNTLDYNYLSAAKRHGAVIRTRSEVKTFAPRDRGGFQVEYVEHLPENEGKKTDTRRLPRVRMTCDRLVLSAGAIGTPFLLLKNRPVFPGISARLGTRFSGNGDFLSFAIRSHEDVDGTHVPRVLDPSFGPVITSFIRVPDTLDGGNGRGFYIQDAGYPEFVNWMLEVADSPWGLTRVLRFVGRWVRGWLGLDTDTDLSAEISALFGDSALSKSSLPMLGMGRDIPNGNMSVQDGRLALDWNVDASRPYFERVQQTMRDIAHTLEARFADDPIWYLGRLITVHSLGGCPMGRDATEGVVDSYGRVFNWPGLYVADGSVMPGPVGANPSLTIAALADRFAEGILNNVP